MQGLKVPFAGPEFPPSSLQSLSDCLACACGSSALYCLPVHLCGFLHGGNLPPQKALQRRLQAALLAGRYLLTLLKPKKGGRSVPKFKQWTAPFNGVYTMQPQQGLSWRQIEAQVGSFQGISCFHHCSISSIAKPRSDPDRRYDIGMAASSAIFIEKKGRRSELALYVLPRAIESLYETLQRRRVLPRLPLWEVALFAVCMGRLMYYRQAVASRRPFPAIQAFYAAIHMHNQHTSPWIPLLILQGGSTEHMLSQKPLQTRWSRANI